jgi:hypothetical protein
MARKADQGRNRKCYGQLPVPSERADLFWSVKQPELIDVTDAQLAALLIATQEFKDTVGRELEAIDNRNRTGYGNKMGRPSKWSALQLESVLVYRRVAGLEDVKRTCERLLCDEEARQLLGLGEKSPSRATITRYIRQHFDEAKRAELCLELDRRLRQRVYQLPGFDEEARILGMDGSQHGTHFTAPIPQVNKKGKTTRKFVNADIPKGAPGAITAETAGYVGGHHPKSGKGWQLLGLWTEHGTLVGWDISPLNESEKLAAERVLTSYEEEVLPHRSDALTVCTADGGFNSDKLRAQLQNSGIVPNIHKASHKTISGLESEQTENASQRNKTWRYFEHPGKPHYANWKANGHGELRCSCEHHNKKKVFTTGKTRKRSIATKGECETCGNVTITVGQWRSGRNNKWVRCYRNNQADLTLGNPLTFNDELSRAYGEDRYGFGESVHATMKRRFGLLKDASWMRDITQVKTEFAITASAISVLLLERDARRQAPDNLAPFPTRPSAPAREADPLPLAA